MANARRDRACRVAALCAAAALTLAAACGGDDSDDDAGASSTTEASDTTAPPTTAPPTPEEEAEAVYLEFVDVVNRLVTTEPNPEDPRLPELAVEPVLGRTRDNLTTLRAENHVWQTGTRSSHHVFFVDATDNESAVLRDCYVGNDTRVDRDDGAVVGGGGLSTELLEVTIARVDGAWRVESIQTVETYDGEVECPS